MSLFPHTSTVIYADFHTSVAALSPDPAALAARTQARPSAPGTWRRWAVVGLLALAAATSLLAVYDLTYRRAAAVLARDARVTAQLQMAVLQSELDKQRSAPVILADDSDVIQALDAPSLARSLAISRKLAKLRSETKSAAIYMIDAAGRTLSASNYSAPTSFVGSNYAFRQYFTDALRNGQAEQFALGTVSLRPGLYIAHRVEAAGRPVGVIVIKVEFGPMEAAWGRARTTTIVTDAAGKILLTSAPALRFQTGALALPDRIVTALPAPVDGWRLSLLTPLEEARRAARSATLIAALALTLLTTLIVWLWRRRRRAGERVAAESLYRARLEADVAARTQELSAANTRLSQEIHERQQTERRLNVLQVDLVQANKLAQLGQITAGVAHEINQPLATIRILAENCLKLVARQKTGASTLADRTLVDQNLGDIVRMSERIGHITGELRTFSRKATGETGPVSLKETLDSSILLNRSRLRHNRVRLVRDALDPRLEVIGGRIRLEQVIVNLLQNAFEALEDSADPVVRISAEASEDAVRLRISDNGPGLSPDVMAQLFTPFVTTKEKGLGLGLVIAHDILRDFGGELTADSSDQGATFTLKLRRARA